MSSHSLRPGDNLIGISPGATVYVAFGRAAFGRMIETLIKASPDDPVHPGWPAGTPGGLGGKFRPKDGADREKAEAAAQAAAERVASRREIRALLLAVLSLPPEIAANAVPVLSEAADVALLSQLAETVSQYRQLAIDRQAASDFIVNGPYSLDELRVTGQSESFSSHNQFVKGDPLDDLLKRFGGAGDGYEYHHLVEQGGINSTNFSSTELQTTDNIVRIPTLLHEAINSQMYSRVSPDPDLTYRQWLQAQSFDTQRMEGIRVMLELGIIK